LFARCYEEHYDISDDVEYNAWLKINHPEVCLSACQGITDVDVLNDLKAREEEKRLKLKDRNLRERECGKKERLRGRK